MAAVWSIYYAISELHEKLPKGYQAGPLSPEQITRVDALLTIDSAMQGIALGSVGEWMLKPNAAPLFAGSAPADYLTRMGGQGYVTVLRQVLRWRAM